MLTWYCSTIRRYLPGQNISWTKAIIIRFVYVNLKNIYVGKYIKIYKTQRK